MSPTVRRKLPERSARRYVAIFLDPRQNENSRSYSSTIQLKYSDVHGQLRALTILKALVENGGSRFQSTLDFPDPPFIVLTQPHPQTRLPTPLLSTALSSLPETLTPTLELRRRL